MMSRGEFREDLYHRLTVVEAVVSRTYLTGELGPNAHSPVAQLARGAVELQALPRNAADQLCLRRTQFGASVRKRTALRRSSGVTFSVRGDKLLSLWMSTSDGVTRERDVLNRTGAEDVSSEAKRPSAPQRLHETPPRFNQASTLIPKIVRAAGMIVSGEMCLARRRVRRVAPIWPGQLNK